MPPLTTNAGVRNPFTGIFTADGFTANGPLQVNGNATITGNLALTGAFTNNGNITSQGNIVGANSGYAGVDAFLYAADPNNPTDACIALAYLAGAKTVIVPGPITINNPIIVPDRCLLLFMPCSGHTVGVNGQLVRNRGSAIIGLGGSECNMFNLATGRTIDFIIDGGGVGAGVSGPVDGIQGIINQPDSTDLSTYNQMGGSWFIHVTKSQTRLTDIKLVGGWKGIFLDGSNSFGATIEKIKLATYNLGLYVEGPVDVTTIDRFEIWPYGPPGTIQATDNQTTAFFKIANVGILMGRADTVFMNKVFTISGLGIHFINGVTGIATGVEMTSCGFENNGCLMEGDGCTVFAASTYFGADTQAQFALAVGAGTFTGVGCEFYNAIAPGTGTAVSNPLVYCNKGVGVTQPCSLDLTNCDFDMKDADQQAIYFDGPAANNFSAGSVVNCRFHFTSNKVYTNPVFNMGWASVKFALNSMTAVGTGSRVYFKNGQTTSKAIVFLNERNGCTEAVFGGSTAINIGQNYF